MNQKIAKSLLILLERLRGEPIDLFLRELEANEKLSRDRVKELQWQRLLKLLTHAYQNSRYYQQRFDKEGLHPSDIRNPDDVGRIPVLTKEEFQIHAEEMLVKSPFHRTTLAKTSGSTGVPLKFLKDRRSFGYTMAAMYRGHRWHGLDIGAKEAMLWGIPRELSKTRIRDFILNRFREKEYNLKDHILEDFFNKMKQKRPDYLMGYASMVYEFSCFLQRNSLDGRQFNLKMVKCTSETIQEIHRQTIEDVFGCRVVSEYGAAETGLIAFECPEGNHHIMTDCVYIHFVEEEVREGEVSAARILVTDLHNYAVPVINYEIGDIVVPSRSECPCGRPFPTIDSVLGRAGDVVLTPDGQRVHTMVFFNIMKGLLGRGGGVRSFKAYQKALDRLKILIVKDKHFGSHTVDFLREEFQRYFGPEMQVDFEFCNSIPREASGKLRDFVQEVDLSAFNGKQPRGT